MQFPRSSTVCLVLIAATSFIALAQVRAQVMTVQPFIGIHVGDTSPRKGAPPIPRTYFHIVAVRSDGSIATVNTWDRSAGGPRYQRDVVDATAKSHTYVDAVTESIIIAPYNDVQAIGRRPCNGIPAGKIEGFDVVYSESTETLNDGSSFTRKEWKAPKLGCFWLNQEWINTRRDGELIGDSKQSLVHIRLGEPDPWYFAIPTNYTTRNSDEWHALMAGLLKK
jgi:hypothetical protein